MPTLFGSRPGRVVAVRADNGDAGLPLVVDGISGSWLPKFRASLTSISVALAGNLQYSHTFDDVIYLYVFGDRIGQLRISGLAFADGCDGGGGDSGFERVLGFYRDNRAAARKTPVRVQVGTTAAGRFLGTINDFRGEVVRPEARLAEFAFTLSVYPGK